MDDFPEQKNEQYGSRYRLVPTNATSERCELQSEDDSRSAFSFKAAAMISPIPTFV